MHCAAHTEWIHVASTATRTLYNHSPKRGREGFEAGGLPRQHDHRLLGFIQYSRTIRTLLLQRTLIERAHRIFGRWSSKGVRTHRRTPGDETGQQTRPHPWVRIKDAMKIYSALGTLVKTALVFALVRGKFRYLNALNKLEKSGCRIRAMHLA